MGGGTVERFIGTVQVQAVASRGSCRERGWSDGGKVSSAGTHRWALVIASETKRQDWTARKGGTTLAARERRIGSRYHKNECQKRTGIFMVHWTTQSYANKT